MQTQNNYRQPSTQFNVKDSLLQNSAAIKTSILSLKKKAITMQSQIHAIDTEISKVGDKIDNLLQESDNTIEWLRHRVSELESYFNDTPPPSSTDPLELKKAVTLQIFEFIVDRICDGSDDYEVMCQAFLFPVIYSHVVMGEKKYLLDYLPDCVSYVIDSGKELLQSIREACDAQLTQQKPWDSMIDLSVSWWKEQALPLLYGEEEEFWNKDEVFTLSTMEDWKANYSMRPINYPTVYDAINTLNTHREEAYEASGIREFGSLQF